MGGRIDPLSVPFAGSVHLPPVISYLVTLLWLVGIANAFNLIDGMDGLASGAALFASLVILGVTATQPRPLMIVVALVLCGSLAGFLRYNFNPASIFLGDSGHCLLASRWQRCQFWVLRKPPLRSPLLFLSSPSVFRWSTPL